ncbi:MAG: hypothetical protein WAL72_28145 [Streptosporangiaceae bacterium]
MSDLAAGELFEGLAHIPELAERAGASVVGGVIEAGQPDSAVFDVHYRGFVEDAAPGSKLQGDWGGSPGEGM